jgi:hypothetical protein
LARTVVYAHRPKRAPPKKKASAGGVDEPTTKPRPRIVVVTSEKQLKRQREDQARAAQANTEKDPEIEAFFARNVRPGGALPPPRKR